MHCQGTYCKEKVIRFRLRLLFISLFILVFPCPWLVPETKTFDLLEKYRVAYTIVDELLLPVEVHLTTDFAYFRWHGHGENIWFDYRYSLEELEPWVSKVQNTANQVKKVYGYFNNHYHGYAPENCLQLLERMGLLLNEQKKFK